MERKCLKCQAEFEGRSDKKYCSDKCRNSNNYSKETYHTYREERLRSAKICKKNNRELYLLNSVKSRAKKIGIPFNLDVDDIVIPTHCPLLGIELTKEIGRCNNTPSIDKINPELGYVKGNVWIVSWKANRIKSNLSKDELQLFCTNLLNKLSTSY